ncbi:MULTISPECIES: dihydroneopterin aldolase [Bradyrhizobium]|uniref:dihydroneopterin aldolase n=1 Tax=Bradyrhizobium centrosematis TaxID=1300039 RepID=UPI0035B6A0AA
MSLEVDKIFLRGLGGHAQIGPPGGVALQFLEVDLEMSIDLASAASSDNLSDTANYAELAREISDVLVNSRHSNLPEAAAAVALAILVFEPRAREVSLTVRNASVALADAIQKIGVSVARRQGPDSLRK